MTLSPAAPFEVQHSEALPHGILVGVAIPDAPDPVPEPVLARLHPDEQAHARTLRGFTQGQWVGGRLAAAAAARTLGLEVAPLLSDARGAPRAARGAELCVSISHKRDLAVALVARGGNGDIGVDIEDIAPERMSVASRVLRPEELAVVMALPEERRWGSVAIRFSVKEAIYKALAPRLQRYIDFQEAEVELLREGGVTVRLHLAHGPAPERIEARIGWLPGRVLSTVRARWS